MLFGRATWNFLALLCLMEFVLFIDRVNLAAAAPIMQKDLGLGNIALGLAFSAFNYSYAPFQLVGGWFADRFGARRTLTVCGLVWSITTMATGAVRGLGSLFAVRLVLGMGEGATLPAANRALSNWTSLATRGTAVGIHANLRDEPVPTRDDDVVPETDVLATPRFAFLRSRTKEDLLAFQHHLERRLKRYEDAQPIVATAVGERGQ